MAQPQQQQLRSRKTKNQEKKPQQVKEEKPKKKKEETKEEVSTKDKVIIPSKPKEALHKKYKPTWVDTFVDFALWLVFMVHLVIAPYSKVEESFNIQACHDVLYHGSDLKAYDHHEFPGVVPRTFIGPVIVSIFSYPFKFAIDCFGLPKFYVQYVVRGVLGTFVALSFAYFRRSVARKYSRRISIFFVIISAVQFHVPFYATRTLPNVFALCFVMVAQGFLLRGNIGNSIWTFVFVCSVFRSDVAVFAGPLFIEPILIRRKYSIFNAIFVALAALIVSLAGTIPLDTIMWGGSGTFMTFDPVWPEGRVLYYNTVMNMSSNWGIMPWHWYFTSALPRALTFIIPLVLLGIIREPAKSSSVILPALAFISLYSFLPHKELRFIIHAIPSFSLVAAFGADSIFAKFKKTILGVFGVLVVIGCICGTAVATVFFTAAGANNYPGGVAFKAIHEIVEPSKTFTPRVYIDVAAAQSGVTHFGESRDPRWVYSRKEGLTDFSSFTHVITENSTIPGFTPIYTASVYGGIDKSIEALPRLFIRTKPGIYIHEKIKA